MDEDLPVVSEIMDDHVLWDEARQFQGRKLRRLPTRPAPLREERAQDLVEVFYLIGGVPRMAAWADKNPGFFYTKLFTKLLPQASTVQHKGSVNILYRPAIPPSPLDGEIIDVTVKDLPCLE